MLLTVNWRGPQIAVVAILMGLAARGAMDSTTSDAEPTAMEGAACGNTSMALGKTDGGFPVIDAQLGDIFDGQEVGVLASGAAFENGGLARHSAVYRFHRSARQRFFMAKILIEQESGYFSPNTELDVPLRERATAHRLMKRADGAREHFLGEVLRSSDYSSDPEQVNAAGRTRAQIWRALRT